MQNQLLIKQLKEKQDTDWIEKNVSEIIKILDIDSLLTIPISLPFMKAGMALSEEELLKVLKIISKNKEGDLGTIDPKSVLVEMMFMMNTKYY